MRLFPARPAPFLRGGYFVHLNFKWCGARILVGIFVIVLFSFSLFSSHVLAQGLGSGDTSSTDWKPDPEVTFIGKSAVRAKEFLDWTLISGNTNWVFQSSSNSGFNQLAQSWELIRNIAYFLTLAIVLFTAFFIIISRGQSFNAQRQLFIVAGVLLLITFSFSIIEFFYGLIDTLQGFFLKLPHGGNTFITSQDLLNISFQYDNFIGFRKGGLENEEAAKVAIFLVKATSITYYAMAGILLLRKIILWFFIILSPLWVLLLPFPLVRNTAKIWMGEFFRWLFYGPLFAVLLAGLVRLWQTNILNFSTNGGDYPTAISILLGGPGVSVDLTHSINNVNTYASYILALLMLWVTILLPFLLLKIFRDAFLGIFKNDNAFLQKAFGSLYPFLGKPPPSSPALPSPLSTGEGLSGIGLGKITGVAREVNISTDVANIEGLPLAKTSDIVKYAGLSVPTLRDLARMEMQKDLVLQNQELLRKISSPITITNMRERSRFSSIQQELLARSKRGDVAATTILAAAESARLGRPVPLVVGTKGAGTPLTAAKPKLMPTVNRMQTVGVDDYEDVKKMWEENYKQGDVPISDKVKSRKEWIKGDITKMESVIELLASMDEGKKKQGLEELAVILPFLLLGGFSDQETTVYLKAKLEAAKKVLLELETETQEKEKILVDNKKEAEAEKHMEAATTAEEETPNKQSLEKPNENPKPTEKPLDVKTNA